MTDVRDTCDNINCNAEYCDNDTETTTTCADQNIKFKIQQEDDNHNAQSSGNIGNFRRRVVTYLYSSEYIQQCDTMLRVPKRVHK